MSDMQRVYTPKGKAAHLTLQGTISLCRMWYPEGFWGTGSQDEYEKAEALPICKTCLKRNGGKE